MRVEELELNVPEGDARLRVHPRLTVLSGLSEADRATIVDGVVALLAGAPSDVGLTYVDATGRRVRLRASSSNGAQARFVDDDGPAPLPVACAGDIAHLRRLVVLATEDQPRARDRSVEPPELRDARDMLEALSAEMRAAEERERARDDLAAQQSELEVALAAAREGAARRRYAQALACLEAVREELTAIEAGEAGAEVDRHLLAGLDATIEVADRWMAARTERDAAHAQLADGELLDPEAARADAAIPSRPPVALAEHLVELAHARGRRDELHRRLRELAASELPEPSDPAVAELAQVDPTALDAARERALRADAELRSAQVALGGLEVDDGPPPAIIAEIEAAHAEVELAEQAQARARLRGALGAGTGAALAAIGAIITPPAALAGLTGAAAAALAGLVLPARRTQRARGLEQRALDAAEAPTYLAFHIRRMEATIDPALRADLERCTAEHRAAHAAWRSLAGSTGPERASELAAEVHAYRCAVQDLGGAAEEIALCRRELSRVAEPAVATARSLLADMCEQYRIDPAVIDEADGAQLRHLVDDQILAGDRARLQLASARAAAAEQAGREELEQRLDDLGVVPGPVDDRLDALRAAARRATDREAARRRARPEAEVRAELAERTEQVAALHRPEWSTVTPADAREPDVPGIEARLAAVRQELATLTVDGAALDRLAERHAALQRRVAALESRLVPEAGSRPVNVVRDHLLAFLTTAATAGTDGDPLPVLLDEAFAAVPADRRWDMLDLLLRLTERHQVICLSDDGFVAAWARRHAAEGTLTLLEPDPEPV